ncbi:hypothetical protein GN543_001486 [Salmonella enterica]|nr:hypothetical protein [Salmonella enterica]EEM6321231.1 hypothetical protein [Salmonella enterica]
MLYDTTYYNIQILFPLDLRLLVGFLSRSSPTTTEIVPVTIGGHSALLSGCCAAGGQFYRMTPHSRACVRFCLAGGVEPLRYGYGYCGVSIALGAPREFLALSISTRILKRYTAIS